MLCHGDYYSGNTVWDGATLTGVVDWPCAASGPPGFDVGWCRLDLYLLYDQAVAGIFLDAYEAARGAAPPGRLLSDLWAVARSEQIVETWVPNYSDLGRGDLTARRLRDRHTAWTKHLLSSR